MMPPTPKLVPRTTQGLQLALESGAPIKLDDSASPLVSAMPFFRGRNPGANARNLISDPREFIRSVGAPVAVRVPDGKWYSGKLRARLTYVDNTSTSLDLTAASTFDFKFTSLYGTPARAMAGLYVFGARVICYDETLTAAERRDLERKSYLTVNRAGQITNEVLEGAWDFRVARQNIADSDAATPIYALTHQQPNERPGVQFSPFVVDLQSDTFNMAFTSVTDLAADVQFTLELAAVVFPNSAFNSAADEGGLCESSANPFAVTPFAAQDSLAVIGGPRLGLF
jgi:hypothetical protein